MLPTSVATKYLLPNPHHDPWWLMLIKILVIGAVTVFMLFRSMTYIEAEEAAIKRRFGVVRYRRFDRASHRCGEPMAWTRWHSALWPLGRVFVYRRSSTGWKAGDIVWHGPGLVIGMPFVHKWLKCTTQWQTMELDPHQRPIGDGLWRSEVARVSYRVVDIKKALIDYRDMPDHLRACLDAAYLKAQTLGMSVDEIEERLLLRDDVNPDQYGVKLGLLRVTSMNLAPNMVIQPPSTSRATRNAEQEAEGVPTPLHAVPQVSGTPGGHQAAQ